MLYWRNMKDCVASRLLTALIVVLACAFSGCRTMDQFSGLMLIGLNVIPLFRFEHDVFGPFTVDADFRLCNEDREGDFRETTFKFRDPDGYSIQLVGYLKEGDERLELDFAYRAMETRIFPMLWSSDAEVEIVLVQDGVEVLRRIVSVREAMRARWKRNRTLYISQYVLLHITRDMVDVWKPVLVKVRVHKADPAFADESIWLSLEIVGDVCGL